MMTITALVALLLLAGGAGVAFFFFSRKKRFSDSRKGSTAALASVWDTVTHGEMHSLSERLASADREPETPSATKMTLEELSAVRDPFPDPAKADWEDPSYLRAESARAMSLNKSGEHDAAVACLENCANSFPGRAEPLLRAAMICSARGDMEKLVELRRRLGMIPSVPLAATILMERLASIARRH